MRDLRVVPSASILPVHELIPAVAIRDGRPGSTLRVSAEKKALVDMEQRNATGVMHVHCEN